MLTQLILKYRNAGDCEHTKIYANSETAVMLVMCQHTFYSEWSHHDVLEIQLTLHRYTSAQSILFLSKATCFD